MGGGCRGQGMWGRGLMGKERVGGEMWVHSRGATHGGRKESRRKEGKQGDEGCWWVLSVVRGCFCFR